MNSKIYWQGGKCRKTKSCKICKVTLMGSGQMCAACACMTPFARMQRRAAIDRSLLPDSQKNSVEL